MNAALIGIGGWGKQLLHVLRGMDAAGELGLKAVSDVSFEQNKGTIDELIQSGVQYHRDYREMLLRERCIDIVVIATPLHLHCAMSVAAMEAGFHVFLEKPPAVTIQDVDAIIAASERTGKHCAIDFLNASVPSFQHLRRLIAAGSLGNIRTITGVGLWERLDNYYSRTNWAGRLAMNGTYVLDGTVNNPLSHLLNNMMLLLQAAPNGGPVSRVTAELYHAHEIEGEDTSCIRIVAGEGIELYFYATLCNDGQEPPYIKVEGERGTACWDFTHKLTMTADGAAVATEPALQGEEAGYPLLQSMFRNLCSVISGMEDRLFCSARDTRGFMLVSNGAFESSAGTHAIPSRFIIRSPKEGSIATHIHGIKDLLRHASSQRRLFSEMNVDWAIPGREMEMRGYRQFDMKF